MSEIAFDKYELKGAYHWTEYFGPVHRINASTRARYHNVLAALRDHKLGKGGRVLDVGCGDGALAGLLAINLGVDVAGVDTTQLPIGLAQQEFGKRKLRGDFRLIDGYRYPFTDGAFNAVVCSDVIEHVREPAQMLKEMWRVLAPGGVLVVTTPVRYTEAPLDHNHVQEWFPAEFRRFCEQALGAPVEARLTHPVAFSELYSSPSAILGRVTRLGANVLSKLGIDLFARPSGCRAFSAQTVVAVKPGAPA